MELVSLIWLGLVIVFLIVEASCPIHLVSVWFAVGSLVALAVQALGGPLWLQVALFLVVSGVLLAALWPLTKRYLKPNLTATNVDSVIGSTGYVTAAIDNVAARGQAGCHGMDRPEHHRHAHQRRYPDPGGPDRRCQGLRFPRRSQSKCGVLSVENGVRESALRIF